MVIDGQIVSASHEERYSRKKQDSRFPVLAIGSALQNAGIALRDLDVIAWYEDPDLKFHRSKQIVWDGWPLSFDAFRRMVATPYSGKDQVSNLISEKLNWRGEVQFMRHHESHMASAVFGKRGYGETIALTLDGIGEFETATAFSYNYDRPEREPERVWGMEYPHSIGLLYSAVTQIVGFEINEGEYKVMGLAPYGTPRYLDELKRLALAPESNPAQPKFAHGLVNWGNSRVSYGPLLLKIFALSRRNLQDLSFSDKADISSSIQNFLEYLLTGIVEGLIMRYNPTTLRMAGGVALNCTANAVLARKFQIPIDVQPAAGDAGSALGAALLASYRGGDWKNQSADLEFPTYLGSPVGSKSELSSFSLMASKKFAMSDASTDEVARWLSQGKIVAIARGRAEFGPRALGNRCILASPLSEGMKNHLNSAIKFREEFRPFAPVVRSVDYLEYFERLPGESARNMLYTVQSLKPDSVPAVTHVDGTSRVQELEKNLNPFLWDVLEQFGNMTGVPVLTLTSFNLKGEPIVQNAYDAISTFERSAIDVLVIEDMAFLK